MAAEQRPDSPNRAKRSRSEHSPALSTASSNKQTGEDQSRLPAFLRQSAREIEAKFEQLNAEQVRRLQSGLLPGASGPWCIDRTQEKRLLNRYTDIWPWDETRVKLKVPAGDSDYINASAISLLASDGKIKGKYIAAQGPRQNNVDHFWQMVWQHVESPGVVVMLTQLTEALREKCYRYFPEAVESDAMALNFVDDEGVAHEGTVKVDNIYADSACKTTVRELTLSYNEKEKKICHLFFQAWPDFGVPQDGDRNALNNLISISRTRNEGWDNPRVIHCSAGVGRTGTFIALEHLIDELEQGHFDDMADDKDPVRDTVNQLREQRMTMVQSDAQYAFLYESLALAYQQRLREKDGISSPLPFRTASEKLRHGEPSPKAVRLSRGFQKLMTQIRSRSSSRERNGETNGKTTEEKPPRSPLFQSRTSDDEHAPRPPTIQVTTSESDIGPTSSSYFEGKAP